MVISDLKKILCLNRESIPDLSHSGLASAVTSSVENVRNIVSCIKYENVFNTLTAFTENVLKEDIHAYEIGKRHLANIMGVDPDGFEQEHIDVSTY